MNAVNNFEGISNFGYNIPTDMNTIPKGTEKLNPISHHNKTTGTSFGSVGQNSAPEYIRPSFDSIGHKSAPEYSTLNTILQTIPDTIEKGIKKLNPTSNYNKTGTSFDGVGQNSAPEYIRPSFDSIGHKSAPEYSTLNTILQTIPDTIEKGIQTLSPTIPYNTTNGIEFSDTEMSTIERNTTITIPVFPEYIKIVSTIFISAVFIIGVIGNLLVLIVILKDRDMRSSTNYILMNLSVADLLVLLVCLPPVLVELHSPPQIWIMGYTMCKLSSYVESTVVHASALSLVVISLERYHVILQPLQAGYRCTTTKAITAILLIWTIALLSAGPFLWMTEYGEFLYYDGTLQPNCIMALANQWAISYITSTHILFFFLPMVLLVILYIIIARRLLVDTYELTHKKETLQMRARRQVVFMIAMVVFFFFLCLLPIRVFFMWIIAVPQETQYNLGVEGFYNILYFCRVMLYINSCINPILYNMTSTKFRNAFRRVFRTKRGRLQRHNTLYSNTSCNPTVTNNIRLQYGTNCSMVYKTVYTKTSNYSFMSTRTSTSQVMGQSSVPLSTDDTFV